MSWEFSSRGATGEPGNVLLYPPATFYYYRGLFYIRGIFSLVIGLNPT